MLHGFCSLDCETGEDIPRDVWLGVHRRLNWRLDVCKRRWFTVTWSRTFSTASLLKRLSQQAAPVEEVHREYLDGITLDESL